MTKLSSICMLNNCLLVTCLLLLSFVLLLPTYTYKSADPTETNGMYIGLFRFADLCNLLLYYARTTLHKHSIIFNHLFGKNLTSDCQNEFKYSNSNSNMPISNFGTSCLKIIYWKECI